MINNIEIRNWKIIRNTDIAKNIPIPTPILIIIAYLSIPDCSAKTIKSGSAIVTKNPNKKPNNIKSHIFLFLATYFPVFSPIFIKEISAPTEKKVIPIIKKTAPQININKLGISNLTNVKLKITPNINIGKTEREDSFILVLNILKITTPP